MNKKLEIKIDKSIRIINATCSDGQAAEVAYSGGKDSDVILQLAKEAGINYRPIYKMTTIDPPGTLRHVKDIGVEVLRPKRNFFQLIEDKGLPSRRRRFCCNELKEYKILNRVIIGVRREESKAREERYEEPTQCRYFGAKKEENHVEQIYPILEWTTEDVAEFLQDRGIKAAPVYYDADGVFHPERRLGCMCCPLQSFRKRIAEFQKHPNMVKAYIRSVQIFLDTHDTEWTRAMKSLGGAPAAFYRDVLCKNAKSFEATKNTLFGRLDYKTEIERIFSTKL